MSRPELPLILSPRAEDDFADILQYSLETWGESQVFEYRDLLDKGLLTIREHPQIGHGRPELPAAHRIFPVGRHSIVNRVTERATLLSCILHERMDLGTHLQSPSKGNLPGIQSSGEVPVAARRHAL